MKRLAAALQETDPARKCAAVAQLTSADLAGDSVPVPPPGRPALPQLVRPRAVPHRGLGTVPGRAALIHAVAHIEFNAINLALDAALRFPDMPDAYRLDWLGVAQDEARHFGLLSARLLQLGYTYGDFPAHNGLWEAAEKTAHDVLARMACVPRVLEARGLDVTPGMIERLRQAGDGQTVAILEQILREEIGHVAIGSRWFAWLCAQRGLEERPTFRRLLAEHGMQVRPPLNHAARLAAGFAAEELGELGRT